MGKYVSLHTHSEFSFLDGYASIKQIADRVKEINGTAVGLTDHGEVSGHIFLEEACKEVGITPIYGMEGYVVDSIEETKEAKSRLNSHYCVWAETSKGLSNLWAISSLAYIEGFYYRPLADWEMLRKYSEGLIASDGCLLSNTARFLVEDKYEEAKAWVSKFISVFGKENFFLELHTWQMIDSKNPHDLEVSQQITKMNHGKVRLARELGLGLIVVNDAHYAERCHFENHQIVWAMSTNQDQFDTRGETAAWIMDDDEIYYWMNRHGISDDIIKEAIENTSKIAERCRGVEISKKLHEPLITGDFIKDEQLFLSNVESGFEEKIVKQFDAGVEMPDTLENYRERLDYELSIILAKGFPGYFNIVADYCKFAKNPATVPFKKSSWLVGPARGSGGGSLTAFLLDITEIDPIKYGLMFERFLNPQRGSLLYIDVGVETLTLGPGERAFLEDGSEVMARFLKPGDRIKLQETKKKSIDYKDFGEDLVGEVVSVEERIGGLPDIDLDFPQSHRGQVKEYLSWRFGRDRVCGIGTFSRLQARGLLRDLGRALQIPLEDVNKMSEVINEVKDLDTERIEVSWDQILRETGGELASWATKYPRLFEKMSEMVGMVRQSSKHAAGTLISDVSLIGQLPLRVKNNEIVTQFDGPTVEKLGFIKYDILGIRHLDTLMECDRLAHGEEDPKRLYQLPEETMALPEIWEQVNSGDSTGIFQIETTSFKSLLPDFKAKNERDIADLIAVNRPGVTRSGQLDVYMKRRMGEEEIKTPHPLMSEVLASTFGVAVYQEQVMKLFQVLAGYSLVEADGIRKIMGKMLFEKMLEEKPKFVERCVKNPKFLEGCVGDPVKVANECWKMLEKAGIYVFNSAHSQAYAMISTWGAYEKHFFPREYLTALMRTDPGRANLYVKEARRTGIPILPPDVNESDERFTLTKSGIRWGLGDIKSVGASAVKEILKYRPYESLDDYLSKTSGRGGRKKTVVENLIKIGAFDSLNPNRSELLRYFYEKNKIDSLVPDLSDENVIFDIEMELAGNYITQDPLEKYLDILDAMALKTPREMNELKVGEVARIGGMISSLRTHQARNGEMAFIEVTYNEEVFPATVFSNKWVPNKILYQVGRPVLLEIKRLDRGVMVQEVLRLDYLQD